MKRIKKFLLSFISAMLIATMFTSNLNALDINSEFIQNVNTANTFGYVNYETDQFETYSNVEGSAGNYTSIASKIYKPLSGDTLIVVFHGNGEGGVDGICNNYAQLAGNRLAVTYTTDELQSAFKGAYVLAFQAPDYWYNDYTQQAKAIIDQAVDEFNIKEVFISGLSAGGLMSQRMLATYGNYFSGALISCSAIAKNDQYIEGLGGDYSNTTEYLDANDPYTDGKTFKKPNDYDQYLNNYNIWLENIAKSNVPIFMVHCYNDPTIYYKWTELAYNAIKNYRETNGLDGDVYCGLIENVSYPDETYSSGHWSWIKMLNGDVYASTDTGLDTITWFKSLSTSTNTYQPKLVSNQVSQPVDKANTYTYNLIATVTNSGEKITSIEINMNGKKVDSTKLTPEMFKITGYNTDASGLAVGNVTSEGIFGTVDNPINIDVEKVSVNEQGNIVLDLATQKGVLNYTSLSRNLTTNIRYDIADTVLSFIDENSSSTSNNIATSVKTGDSVNTVLTGSIMIISLIIIITINKNEKILN